MNSEENVFFYTSESLKCRKPSISNNMKKAAYATVVVSCLVVGGQNVEMVEKTDRQAIKSNPFFSQENIENNIQHPIAEKKMINNQKFEAFKTRNIDIGAIMNLEEANAMEKVRKSIEQKISFFWNLLSVIMFIIANIFNWLAGYSIVFSVFTFLLMGTMLSFNFLSKRILKDQRGY